MRRLRRILGISWGGQSAQRSGSCPCRPPHNVNAAQTTPTAPAWQHVPYGRRSDPQGHLLVNLVKVKDP